MTRRTCLGYEYALIALLSRWKSAVTNIIVQKFGGSSLATIDRIHRVAELVAEHHWLSKPTAVVVSARGNTTDELLGLAGEVGELSTAREVDQLLATGECVSAALLAMVLNKLGVPAVSLTGAQAGIVATGKYGSGRIHTIETNRIAQLLSEGNVAVIAGFQGMNSNGDVVTLGRGGSDTTAVALAAKLQADLCEIYTDVDGVCTADPRVISTARVLPTIDVGLMAEMAFAGAKVLHSRSVDLAAMYGVEVHVRNSYSQSTGTIISRGNDGNMLETHGTVVAVTHDSDVATISVRAKNSNKNLATGVLAILARTSIPVDMVSGSGPHEEESRIRFSIRRSSLGEVIAPLRHYVAGLGGEIHIDENVGKLSLIGTGLLNHPEYTARMLSILAAAGIATSWISTSQLRTSVLVPRNRLIETVSLLHHEFQLGKGEFTMLTQSLAST
jgi:aspartate kinase